MNGAEKEGRERAGKEGQRRKLRGRGREGVGGREGGSSDFSKLVFAISIAYCALAT